MSNLLKRLDKHFTICAAAAAGAAAIGTAANATIQYTVFNHVIPNNTDGTYLNVETHAFVDGPGSGVTGWDVNPFGSSTTAISFFVGSSGSGYMRAIGDAAGTSNLTLGTAITAGSNFAGGNSDTTAGAGQWFLNADNIVGFKFLNGAAAVRYGWMRIHVGATFGVRNFVDYAYEDNGGSINAGDVPGPAGLAVLALGAVGVRSRRRK